MSRPSPTCGGTADMLPRERARCSFDVATLAAHLTPPKKQGKSAQFQQLFAAPPFDDDDMDVYRSYEDIFRKQVERVAAAFKIVRGNAAFRADHIGGKVQMQDLLGGQPHGIYVHFTMFLTYIQSQASKEQQKEWLLAARQGRFIGAYCQTELGHGSNVRGLETLATYDPETEEFDIHSPTLTSLKWWPTGMYSCTHALVFAQLIVRGKNHGFHGFLVQLRDQNGEMMPGVELGEIGPKLNGKNANIGYARFTHVRVPRFNMFARYNSVAADGTYTATPRKLSKFKYVSMMQSRVQIIAIAYRDLARAAAIAVRYSAVRVQGFKDTTADDPAQLGEHVVLDYRMQQCRTFRALAVAYMLSWNKRYIGDYLKRVTAAINAGDEKAADELPEMHATISGMKAVSTLWAHAGIEECRRCCGGQGFLTSSGIAQMSPNFAEWVTVEGEQVILSLQCARFLINAVRTADTGGELASTTAYLTEPPLERVAGSAAGGDAGVRALIAALKDRAARFARKLAAAFARARGGGAGFDDALNSVATLAYKAAECHTVLVMALNNEAALRKYVTDAAVGAALRRLLELALLQHAHECAADWVGRIDEAEVDRQRDRIDALLGEIRPDAIGLVDAFGWTDVQLNSTLGRHDGNVYEAIYAEAKKSPLNRAGKMAGWEFFADVLDLDFLKQGAAKQRALPSSTARL